MHYYCFRQSKHACTCTHIQCTYFSNNKNFSQVHVKAKEHWALAYVCELHIRVHVHVSMQIKIILQHTKHKGINNVLETIIKILVDFGVNF